MGNKLHHFRRQKLTARTQNPVVKILASLPVIWYCASMKKSLLETNPFLKDPATRNKSLARNVVSSSAVEGIRVKRDSASGRFVTCAEEVPTKHSKTSR
jgi:hypothetical protein